MNIAVIIIVLARAAVGLGLFLILREFAPGAPALGPALRQLHAPTPGGGVRAHAPGPLAAVTSSALLGGVVEWAIAEVACAGHGRE